MSVIGFTHAQHTEDLGDIAEPILVFGGPYSNLEATRAMLTIARRHGVAMDRVICTGDVVAYCADPQDTIDAVREAGVRVVMGNCEESLGLAADDCGCGFDEGSACDVASRQWYSYAAGQITDDARRWMRELPRLLLLRLAGRRFAVIHGGVSEINRFIFASTPDTDKLTELHAAGVDAVIAGHCGLPFTQVIDDKLWHNAGVIGMPANDGTPRGWYSLLEPQDDHIRVRHHAFDYDHATAATKMRARGLPSGYADALITGLWPSLDILPASERVATGAPLAPGEVVWRAAELEALAI